MNEQVRSYYTKILEYEERGFIREAIQLFDKVLSSFSDDTAELLLEGAKLKYRNGFYESALLNFVEAYRLTEDISIYDLVVEAYYQGNRTECLETYLNNKNLLETYKLFNSNENLTAKPEVLPIWFGEGIVVWVNASSFTFHICRQVTFPEMEFGNDVLAVINEVNAEKLLVLEKNSRFTKSIVNEEIPLYLIYDKEYLEFVLQTMNIGELIETKRVVFLIGEEAVRNYFLQDMTLMPGQILNEKKGGRWDLLIRNIISDRKKEKEEADKESRKYYEEHVKEIVEEIKKKKIRIMLLTSRFTNVLQYHAKSCERAAHRLGYDVRLVMEKDDICRITDWDMKRLFAEFKPHIVISFDYFRFHESVRQKEIVWVTWIQDPMPHIMDKNTPEKLITRDIVMSHFTTWETFKKLGYQDVIDAPIPADAGVYQPYQLSEAEFNQYECDICFVCHASDVKEHIDWICEDFPPEWRQRISFLYQGYQNYVNQTGELFYKIEQFIAFVDGVLKKTFGISADKEIVNYIANDMFSFLNQRIYRQCLVDWLLDAGYTNLKLWGNGWTKEEKYAKYAMGPAENGETLSKIYQASKIVLGNNVMTTAAARAWESMLSGAFYLSNYIPPEDDITDIRKIVKENEELIMFYDKEDLLRKVDYYLNHEEERKRMAEIGRKAALERMTFDKLMEKVIEEIPKIIEKREKKEMQEQNG